MQKLRNQQKDRPTILCEDEPLENVFSFKYLGIRIRCSMHLFEYRIMDVKVHIVRVTKRCGQLRHILLT